MQTRSDTQIEVKREVAVIHAIDYTNRCNSCQTEVSLTKGNCHGNTTTDGYIKLGLINIEFGYLIVGGSVEGKIGTPDESKAKVTDQVEIIHAILNTNTRVGAKIQTYSQVCFRNAFRCSSRNQCKCNQQQDKQYSLHRFLPL